MKIRYKKEHKKGHRKSETSGYIKEIFINDDFTCTKEESIALCFRGKDSSGIIELQPFEIEELYNAIKPRIHAIKAFKRLSCNGAKLLE